MSLVRQTIAITCANLRCLPQRAAASLVIVVGIAGVVGVLISVLAMAAGFRQTMANTGSDDRVIILARGTTSEYESTIERAVAQRVMDLPGITRADDGKPVVSAELLVQARLRRRDNATDGLVTVRGAGEKVFALHPEYQLIAGRTVRPGVHELVVGKAAQLQFAGLNLGDRVPLRDGGWTVVGLFTSRGDSHESELLADAETVMSAYRSSVFYSVTAKVDSARDLEALRAQIRSDPALKVDAKREREYLAAVSQPFNKMLALVTYLIGGVMAIGALAGALNTMYSAVSARAREMATLRALGFSGAVVVGSIFVEAILLAAIGAGIGVAAVCVLFNGHGISMMSAVTDSQLMYSLRISPGLIGVGVATGILIGFLGALFPAIQVARRPVVAALRET